MVLKDWLKKHANGKPTAVAPSIKVEPTAVVPSIKVEPVAAYSQRSAQMVSRWEAKKKKRKRKIKNKKIGSRSMPMA